MRWVTVFALLAISVCAQSQDIPPGRSLSLYLDATGGAIDDAALASLRGGADTQTNDIFSSGTVAQNEAHHLTTGSNFVNGGSFSNAAGFPTVVQNSGNNVLIQNSTIINLQLQ